MAISHKKSRMMKEWDFEAEKNLNKLKKSQIYNFAFMSYGNNWPFSV
jgi:hypothetical protein